jgi:hypothetical protein
VVRLLSLLAFGFLAGLVILIYDMKFETRRLETRAAQLTRAIEDEKDNVALMRAEWSHVTAPDRIERLALEILPLQPVKSTQLIKQEEFVATFARMPIPPVHPATDDAIGDLIRKEKVSSTTPKGDEIGALIRNDTRGRNIANASAQ